MTKIDRSVFTRAGAKGGSVKGPSKRRGDSAFYKRLSELAIAARKAKKEQKP